MNNNNNNHHNHNMMMNGNAMNMNMNGNHMMNHNMNNGNAMNNGYNPNMNMNANPMQNQEQNQNPMQNASAPPMMNSIQRGNQSVLNVLTGEPSPPQSYPATSAETTPIRNPPNQSTPGKAEPGVSAVSVPAVSPQQKTKGNDDDPFGGMVDDPFADMAAPAFVENKENEKPKASAPPSTLKKQNSDNIIIDMFASAGPADPNDKKAAPSSGKNLKAKEDNPFDSSNPFGSSAEIASTDNVNNPFEDLENPFGDSGGDVVSDDNPFAMFTPIDNQKSPKKQEDFMAERDPFADM